MTVVGSVDIAVSLLDADYQRKKQAIANDIAKLQDPKNLKIELDNGRLLRQLSDARRSISDVAAVTAKADLTGSFADRSITRADFDQQFFAIRQGQSRARIEIAKNESAEIERLLSRESSGTRVQLLARLNTVRGQIATESLEIEKRRVQDVVRIEQQNLKNGTAVITLIADARRRSLDGEIADQQRLQAAYGITVNQQQRQRQAIAGQSAALNTQIGLLEGVAKAAVRQTTELQNLSKLSVDPKSNRFTREESKRQVKELTGKDSLGELRLPGLDIDQSLLVRKQQQEDQVALLQSRALAAQITQKQLGLELDLKSEALSRGRVLQEQKIGFLKAQQNFVSADQKVQQAGFELDFLPKNASLREQAIAEGRRASFARNKFENAKSDYAVSKTGLDISAQGMFDARASIAEFRLFAEQARKALGLQTDGSKGLFNLEDGARERRQSLELAREGIDPTRFNRRMAASPFTEQDFGDPNFGRQGFSGQGSNSQFLTGGLNLQPIVDVNERIFNQNAEVISVLGEIRSALTGRTEPTESRPPSVLRGRGI